MIKDKQPEKMVECDVCGEMVPVSQTEHCTFCGRTYCFDCEGYSVGICQLCEEEEDDL